VEVHQKLSGARLCKVCNFFHQD
jgi:hypothetical protein